MESYENTAFIKENGEPDLRSINIRMTEILMKYGYQPNGKEQEILGIHIYPMSYFCPLSLDLEHVKDCVGKDTYCIAKFDSEEFKRERRWYMKLGRALGLDKLKRKILKR